MRSVFGILALSLAACSPPSSDAPPVPVESGPSQVQAPADVMAAVNAAVPGFTVANSVSDNSTGAEGYRISGTANGLPTEVQLMRANEGWSVVSVRRDIAWTAAPESVRAALAAAPNAFEPARVVEVRDTGADGVVYDVYAPGSDTPVSIREVGGEAAIMPAPH